MLTIQQLFAAFDEHAEAIPLQRLMRLMRLAEFAPEDICDCIHFNDERYQRNLLRLRSSYAALILCWKAGQCTPIHDHAGSACGVRVLEGVATETRYDRRPDGRLVESQSIIYPTGSVCGSYDADIHVLANAQSFERRLITMHIYTPPLSLYHTYSLDNAEITTRRDMETLAARRQTVGGRTMT